MTTVVDSVTGRHSHVIYSVAAVILLLLVTAAILAFVGYRKGELCMPTESQENIHPGLQVSYESKHINFIAFVECFMGDSVGPVRLRSTQFYKS